MARHIYVHIPFCARKCDYCDFYSVASKDLMSDFFRALKTEIEKAQITEDVNPDNVDTIYFGGGTPSVPDASDICDILRLIKTKFVIGDDAEITIECNPASVTPAKFNLYKEAGFNRVSIGVQSLHDKTLKVLGRLHDRDRAIACIKEASEAGFKNISADLMLGIPGQEKEELFEDAGTLLSLGVSHVSMYSLIIEEGTKFYDRYRNLEDIVDPDLEREMYHGLRELLSSNGLEPYEISNCGKMSIHNMSYWRGMEYYAFGAAASGYLNKVRFSHPRDIKRYIDDPLYVEEDEILDREDMMKEYVMLMLRTSDGAGSAEFRNRFGEDMMSIFSSEIAKLQDQGLIEISDGFVRLTRKGLDLANVAFGEFI